LPDDATSEGLLHALSGLELEGATVLVPGAAAARGVLASGLRRRGADVDELALYETRVPAQPDDQALESLQREGVDVVTFASSSSVQNLATLLGDLFPRLNDAVIACIGPITATSARKLGLRVDIEPSEHTIPALVQAIMAYFNKTPAS
jgi:uroporphyrinogen-III synthase